MADVLIVCVREDEPQAKALAEMFEAAGFTIGGAPSNDAALRSSGAGVVVWSQASIRSRPFLDAAQRVINANKAIVASLIEPPPPSSIGSSPAFDLSQWDGDPNDPSLDPLFFAVDRMVNSARVGAPARQEEYEPPASPQRAPAPAPRIQAPPVAAERPVYRAPPPPAAPADPLAAETEHWRNIRDSRDPSDFMDYLSRFGPQGAFAEVAELRLKQLTAERQPQRAIPAPAPAPMPPTRTEAPTRREVAPPQPQRRPDPPPQRRAETPPPPPRRVEPPRRAPPEYNRADLREPPRNQGGPVRAFVLIGLLGAAALAGGLYFGGGMGDQGAAAPQEQAVSDSSLGAPGDTPLPGEPEDATQLAASEVNRFDEQAAAREEARDRERERQRERERELAAARAEPTPPPTTNVVAEPPRSGPVSLTPSTSNASSPGTVQQGAGPIGPSLSPPVNTPSRPTTEPVSAAQQPAPTAGAVSWAQRPSARRIADLYPQRALREGTGGRVTLDCVVQPSLSAVCSVASESPAGEGFGRAALGASSAYRASPTLSNGESSVGARTRISVAFQAPN